VVCCICSTYKNMGNINAAGFFRLRGSLPFPSHLQLGTHATINTKTTSCKFTNGGGFSETVEVSYSVEGSRCKLILGRVVCSNGNVNIASFVLNDSIICSEKRNLCLPIHKIETGFLCPFDSESEGPITWKTKKNVHAWDGYGHKSLLVWHCK